MQGDDVSADFSTGYYLADGNHPLWSVFVQGFFQPESQKAILYNVAGVLQKRRRKGFRCSQHRWNIIYRPSNLWFQKDMTTTITACIIRHNMIVEDQVGSCLIIMRMSKIDHSFVHILSISIISSVRRKN